jgi:hypothetical protein
MKYILSAFLFVSLGAFAAGSSTGEKESPDRSGDQPHCHYYDADKICDCYGTDEQCKGPGTSGSPKANKPATKGTQG